MPLVLRQLLLPVEDCNERCVITSESVATTAGSRTTCRDAVASRQYMNRTASHGICIAWTGQQTSAFARVACSVEGLPVMHAPARYSRRLADADHSAAA